MGCGTGRVLPALRDAVGPDGAVIGLDVTPQMLAVARSAGRRLDRCDDPARRFLALATRRP